MDKTAILSLASSLVVESVEVGDGKAICVRTLTGRERDAFENACFTQRGSTRTINTENIRAKLLVRAICDADGKRLFDDSEVDALGALPATVLDKLFTRAQALSGLAEKDVEELAKN